MKSRKDSLFKLAENKKLPYHQFIDVETIEWIKKNRPKFGKTKNLGLPERAIIERFVPLRKWFLEDRLVNSIHGLRHMIRVGVNVVLVVSNIPLYDKDNLKNILIASALHDIRRKNDKGDPNHGGRAAEWFRKNIVSVEKKFKVKFQDRDVKEIYWCIFFHELPRAHFEKDSNYLAFRKAVDVVRIADALDRYRLPKIKWWIDDRILGLTVPANLKGASFNLMIKSEQRFLEGDSSRESVLNILK